MRGHVLPFAIGGIKLDNARKSEPGAPHRCQ